MARSYNRFPQIIATLNARLEPALDAGRQAIAADARARAHVDSGEMRDSIHVDGEYVVAGAWHSMFEEFGTVHSPAHPFMVPAAEARREEVVGLAAAALRKL
jgi:HK97 gp10 family phage protein